MNETKVLEIMEKRSIQLTFLSIVFVGMMMVFLIPNFVVEAQAAIDGSAVSFVGPFSDVKSRMYTGYFTEGPLVRGPTIVWKTTGYGGNEIGYIESNFEGFGKVRLGFENPTSGRNTCETFSPSPSLFVGCFISQGVNAKAFFQVGLFIPGKSGHNYCDILAKLGDIKQAKIIREKLHC